MDKVTARWTIFAISLALSAGSAANPARHYRLVNLDAVIGVQVTPFAINDDGLVALRALENGRVVSLLYDTKTGAAAVEKPLPPARFPMLLREEIAACSGANRCTARSFLLLPVDEE